MNDLNELARRLERAQALLNERLNAAAGGKSFSIGGGFAHFRGPQHPLNQALGLIDPVSEDELKAVEHFLGDPTVLELSPAADAELWKLLGRRGYRVHQFLQLWVRTLSAANDALPRGTSVRIAERSEETVFSRLVAAGFMSQENWRTLEPPFLTHLHVKEVWGFIVSVEGEPAGGALLGIVDGVALLAGDAVLPPFRGKGLQQCLIRARLRHAFELGCDIACAGSAPATASQRSYEACGFRAAYPKLEMALGRSLT